MMIQKSAVQSKHERELETSPQIPQTFVSSVLEKKGKKVFTLHLQNELPTMFEKQQPFFRTENCFLNWEQQI